MKTYTLKSVAKRGGLLGAAFALVAATFVPVASTYADALNPLTERSLTLSSSSPGWSHKDGSGNDTYAQPNSGANGLKTGNTFQFRVSSASPSGSELKAMTFQYCTTSAGNCMGPGNITPTGSAGAYVRGDNDATAFAAKESDLEIVTATPTEVSTFSTKFNAATGVPSSNANMPNRDNSEGNYIVLHKTNVGDPWVQSTGWTMSASENQTKDGIAGTEADGTSTGKSNFITLKNTAGQTLAANDYVKVIFFGTNTNYITNPGSSWFFVKINTYKSDTTLTDANLIDGGVTVANVMNQSIEIQTKVLETMDFSVGTVDPNTLDSTGGAGSELDIATGRTVHATCDPIAMGMDKTTTTPNVLKLGNADGEFSLETMHTYSTHSYWRLSSNSSAGATVYYSGVTLKNTVGDEIEAIGPTKSAPTPGAEQFGLALDNGTGTITGGVGSGFEVSYDKERDNVKGVFQNGADNAVAGLHTASLTANNVLSNASWHAPRLAPLAPKADYANGTGIVNSEYGTVNTEFAFDPESNLIPTPIASEDAQVVDCVTGKVRYIANIAATTPAGIYTTKINYIAAPQY